MRRATLRLLAVPTVLLLGIAGQSCGKLTGALRPNAPPQTTIFVQGPVDTVNHIVHLYWYGSDAAGYVTGYDVRMLNPETPADTAWRFTTRTDSVLTVRTSAGAVSPVFEARAVDDEGLRDPSPARQLFNFNNTPPIVRLTLKPGVRDTTFQTVTVNWSTSDPDGDATAVVYRVWLDGQESAAQLTTTRPFTMPSSAFRVNGDYVTGPRTLYIQGIDDGGMAGPVDSVRWNVRRPVPGARARLLIVDEVPGGTTGNPANARMDSLYANAAARFLASDAYTIIRLDQNRPFASAKDLEQTFKHYEAVVWYRGNQTNVSTTLRDFQAGIGPYVSSGGKLMLEGLYLFSGLNSNGAISDEFVSRYLDCNGLRRAFIQATTFADSSVGWGNAIGTMISTMYADTTRQPGLPVQDGRAGGLHVFLPRNASTIALMAPPGVLVPANVDSLPVGVSVPQSGGGRVVVLTIALGQSLPVNVNSSARLLSRIYAQLGLDQP